LRERETDQTVVGSAPVNGGTVVGGAPMGGGRWVCNEIKGKVRRGTRERETSVSGGDGQRSRVGARKGGSSPENGGKSEPKMGGARSAVEMGRDHWSTSEKGEDLPEMGGKFWGEMSNVASLSTRVCICKKKFIFLIKWQCHAG